MFIKTVIASLLVLSLNAGVLNVINGYVSSENVTSGMQIPQQTIVQTASNGNTYSPQDDSSSAHIRQLIQKLEQYASTISIKKFDHKTINSIKKIYNTLKTEEMYSLSLPNIIQLSHTNINNKIGARNFIFLMKLLNIKPLSMNEFDSPKYDQLDAVTKLLILSSRAMVHSYAMTNLFDYNDPDFDANSNEVNMANYPWLIMDDDDYDTQCILDNIKVIYEHAFDFLSHQPESKLAPLDSIYYLGDAENEYLLELMNDYGFIPWNRMTAEDTADRSFDEFMDCYAIGTGVIFNTVMEDVHLPFRFLEGFDMVSEYRRKKECDACN